MKGAGKILLTRPAGENEDMANALSAAGIEVLIEPLLKIIPAGKTNIGAGHRAAVFTSMHAIRHGPDLPADIPVFCPGVKTGAEARGKGFTHVFASGSGAEGIPALIEGNIARGGKILYLRGEAVAVPLRDLLEAGGYKAEEKIVYRAEKVKSLTDETVAAIRAKSISGVIMFSERTAENFAQLASRHDLLPFLNAIKLLCISARVLKSVHTYGWNETYIAPSPDFAGLLQLALSVCKDNRKGQSTI